MTGCHYLTVIKQNQVTLRFTRDVRTSPSILIMEWHGDKRSDSNSSLSIPSNHWTASFLWL